MFKHNPTLDNNDIEMFMNKISVQSIQEETPTLEATILLKQFVEIKGDPKLLQKIRGITRRESRVTQEMAKQPNLVWEEDSIVTRENLYPMTKN